MPGENRGGKQRRSEERGSGRKQREGEAGREEADGSKEEEKRGERKQTEAKRRIARQMETKNGWERVAWKERRKRKWREAGQMDGRKVR